MRGVLMKKKLETENHVTLFYYFKYPALIRAIVYPSRRSAGGGGSSKYCMNEENGLRPHEMTSNMSPVWQPRLSCVACELSPPPPPPAPAPLFSNIRIEKWSGRPGNIHVRDKYVSSRGAIYTMLTVRPT
jgi:hypothetical protein